MPTIEEIQKFYKEYEDAYRNRNVDFLKAMLPSDMPEDEFTFVLDMSHHSILSLDAFGVKPEIEQDKNCFNLIYQGELGDGMTKHVIDFYFHDGSWLKYNPEE